MNPHCTEIGKTKGNVCTLHWLLPRGHRVAAVHGQPRDPAAPMLESLRLENISEVIKSKHELITAVFTAEPRPQGPHPAFGALPGMVTPPLPWAAGASSLQLRSRQGRSVCLGAAWKMDAQQLYKVESKAGECWCPEQAWAGRASEDRNKEQHTGVAESIQLPKDLSSGHQLRQSWRILPALPPWR